MRLYIKVILVFPFLVALCGYGQEINIDDLIKNIRNYNSVEDFISTLGIEYQNNYTLVYNSRNPGITATIENPKIIQFSNNGRTFISYAGSKNVSKGGEILEVIQMDQSGKYNFYNFDFSKDVANGRVEINPSSCLKCHGEIGKPIWDSYPYWPGAYGSDHDILKDKRISGEVSSALTKYDSKFIEKSIEFKNLKSFLLRNNTPRDRYKYLNNLSTSTYTDFSNLNMYLNRVIDSAMWDSIFFNIKSKSSTLDLLALYFTFYFIYDIYPEFYSLGFFEGISRSLIKDGFGSEEKIWAKRLEKFPPPIQEQIKEKSQIIFKSTVERRELVKERLMRVTRSSNTRMNDINMMNDGSDYFPDFKRRLIGFTENQIITYSILSYVLETVGLKNYFENISPFKTFGDGRGIPIDEILEGFIKNIIEEPQNTVGDTILNTAEKGLIANFAVFQMNNTQLSNPYPHDLSINKERDRKLGYWFLSCEKYLIP
jgi:hypothetical protein